MTTVEEYLRRGFHPDREFVDGQIIERNLGEKTHSSTQRNVICWFWDQRKELEVDVFPEQRVQVSPTRFRIPDVAVVKTSQVQGEIFTAPPHLCVEILSKDDTMEYMQEKIDDYLRFGVPYIWIINPRLRKGYVATKAGVTEAAFGILETSDPSIQVPVSEILDID